MFNLLFFKKQIALLSSLKSSLPNPRSWRFSLMVSSKSFKFYTWYLYLWSILIFGCGLRFRMGGTFFAYVSSTIPEPLLKLLSLLERIAFVLLSRIHCLHLPESVSGFSMLFPLINVTILLPVLPCRDWFPPNLSFFFKTVFTILVPLPSHMNFRIQFLISIRNLSWILIGITLYL